MKLLIWLCLLACLRLSLANAMLFALPEHDAGNAKATITTTANDQSHNDDDFIGKAIRGLKQYFAGRTRTRETTTTTRPTEAVDENSSRNKTGLYDVMETALEHATDIWQQFKKGLLRFIGNDEDNDVDQAKPIANVTAAITTIANSTTAGITTAASTTKPTTTSGAPLASSTSTTGL